MAFQLHEAAEELRRLDEIAIENERQARPADTARERGREERLQLQQRLEGEQAFHLASKLQKCGVPVPLVCVTCGQGKVVETRCKKRWCPACAWSVQRTRMERFGGAIDLMQWPLFITLTAPNSHDPEAVRKIRKDWGKMRRRKLLKERISGGIAAIEITNRGEGWHPHLHIICDCEWLSLHTPEIHWSDSQAVREQKMEHAKIEVTALWGHVIGHPQPVTWIKRVSDPSFLRYCLKYSVKGTDLIESPDPIAPMIEVMEKSRLVSAFGNLHGRTAEMVDEDPPVPCCCGCGQEKTFLPMDIVRGMSRVDPEKVLPTMPRQRL